MRCLARRHDTALWEGEGMECYYIIHGWNIYCISPCESKSVSISVIVSVTLVCRNRPCAGEVLEQGEVLNLENKT